jgi:hypothetical protein
MRRNFFGLLFTGIAIGRTTSRDPVDVSHDDTKDEKYDHDSDEIDWVVKRHDCAPWFTAMRIFPLRWRTLIQIKRAQHERGKGYVPSIADVALRADAERSEGGLVAHRVMRGGCVYRKLDSAIAVIHFVRVVRTSSPAIGSWTFAFEEK